MADVTARQKAVLRSGENEMAKALPCGENFERLAKAENAGCNTFFSFLFHCLPWVESEAVFGPLDEAWRRCGAQLLQVAVESTARKIQH